MKEILYKYLPKESVIPCFELIKNLGIFLKIVNERQSRHGDYQRLPDGTHKITINASLNKYQFLMTLIHEIAHLVAITKYGRQIKPHGNEWKHTYQALMKPFLRPEIFPSELLSYLVIHFQNPSASSDTDVHLSLAMRQYDEGERIKYYVFELPQNSYFQTDDGRIFQKGEKKVKRYECKEVKTGKKYVIQPHALVERIENKL
ncbi:MAG: SprT-like domain-containing protein [Capnocytophaga sp.]|nr:SprT-like domain-containing protein [Capnocytophaga sp.]